MVTVIGPVDTAPGKKMNYPYRQIPRGLAESKAVKELGIEIVENIIPGTKGVEVENAVERRGPGRKSKAELENEQLRAELAELKEKMNADTKLKTDAAEK